jgi:hypothetical protein
VRQGETKRCEARARAQVFSGGSGGSDGAAPVVKRRGHGGGCGRAAEARLHGAGTGAGTAALRHGAGAVAAASKGARRQWRGGSEREARSW